ncbi:sugar ABC transporter substrate-binding protein [Arcanobacterium bovis]|uniref:Sugar ABC transporter substrate-binding protein n=2 Tax=Arcanobacterium bovis TaxID=2529275 RepID=A0A4Q9UZ07_9ACTO|nr:sugar ABC transporter substrate-binding protein [Arcanobacterium bovis]
MRMIKKIAAIGAVAALSLSACSGNAGDKSDSKAEKSGGTDIGVSLPQKTSENWVEAENYFKELCEASNLKCDVQFANDGVPQQQQQLDAMITNGAKVLIIGAVDGSSLGTQLQKAADAKIPVIAYDRLLLETKNIDYYVAYDNFGVGVKQGEALLKGLEAKKAGGPWNIELIAGSNDDSNSAKFFDGAMSILKPEIDAGKVKVVSGQMKREEAATQGWKPENAQTRMDAILTQHYQGSAVPDGILSPNDTLARAALTSVQQAGKSPLPVVTGQDSELESLKWIMEGKQYSTISKPTKPLVENVVALAKELIAGKKDIKELNGIKVDAKQYNNKVKDVPAFLLEPKVATKDNAAEVYKDEPTKLEAVKSATK